jgi:hypothetical protein
VCGKVAQRLARKVSIASGARSVFRVNVPFGTVWTSALHLCVQAVDVAGAKRDF